MIRLKSASQAESLRGKIPDLAIELMAKFSADESPYYPDGLYGPGKAYDPDVHGYLIVIEAGDDIDSIPEAGEQGLLSFLDDDDIPPFEYVSYSIENGQKIYEAVMAIDSDKTIAFIIPESVPIDDRLRQLLQAESNLNI